MLPKVFIGSATENIELVNALRAELSRVASCVTDKKFAPGKSFLSNLLHLSNEVDFAVFVLAADDIVTKRGMAPGSCPRDNVIFELGMAYGALGDERTITLCPKGHDLQLPTDLHGLHHLEYDVVDDDPSEGMIVAVQNVIRKIKKEGIRTKKSHLEALVADKILIEKVPELAATDLKRSTEGKRISGQGIAITKEEESFLVKSGNRTERQVIKISGAEWWGGKDGWKADEAIVNRLQKYLPKVKFLA
ncbi:MAG: TIR domain-containing protein [Rhizobium ruizarguesonis]